MSKYRRVKKLCPYSQAILEQVFTENVDKIFFYATKGKRDYAKAKFLTAADLGLAPNARTLLRLIFLPEKENQFPLKMTFQPPEVMTSEGRLVLSEQDLARPYVNNQIRNGYIKTAIAEGKSIAEINTFLIAMNLREATSEEYEELLELIISKKEKRN